METISKDMAMYYAEQLEEEVYHIFNLIEVIGVSNKFPADIKENILQRTKKNISNIKVQLSL